MVLLLTRIIRLQDILADIVSGVPRKQGNLLVFCVTVAISYSAQVAASVRLLLPEARGFDGLTDHRIDDGFSSSYRRRLAHVCCS
jgi:hypothetical protein